MPRTRKSPDDLLTVAESAAELGLTAPTWRGYVSKGYAPPADDPDEDRPANRRSPRWKRSTVHAFRDNRLGQGRRTDIEAGDDE